METTIMGNGQTEKPKQLCTIRVAFPVESDEQAIEVKKKITDILVEIPDAAIEFRLIPVRSPTAMPPPSPG